MEKGILGMSHELTIMIFLLGYSLLGLAGIIFFYKVKEKGLMVVSAFFFLVPLIAVVLGLFFPSLR